MKKTAFIATLPKSGTWYMKIFFWYYDQLLCHPEKYLSGDVKPNIEQALGTLRTHEKSRHRDSLGIDALHILHSGCPGFTAATRDSLFEQWQSLQFPAPAYNTGEWHARSLGTWDSLDPMANPHVRIVYIYRNPLDQLVSYYHYMQKSTNRHYSSKMLPSGEFVPFGNLNDFVFDYNGLSGFIKHYYAYRQMNARCGSQLMMMPYEKLTTDSWKSFYDILSFLGAAPKTATQVKCFEMALALSSKTAVMNLENRLNGSLAGDQHAGGKHVRDGGIGKWRAHFSDNDLEAIESVMNMFDMSLNEFILNEDNTALSWLATIDAARKQAHQIRFLQQQLNVIGTGIRTEIANIMASRSWRMTAPLRALNKAARNLNLWF